MPVIVRDCPHCEARKMTFDLNVHSINPSDRNLFYFLGACKDCNNPVCISVRAHIQSQNPAAYSGNLDDHSLFKVGAMFPTPISSNAPTHLPPEVESPFKQGENSLRRQDFDAAGAMFRKALDVGIRKIDTANPATNPTLFSRIQHLMTTNKITSDLGAWAHHVRVEGNTAVHDDIQFTKLQAEELESFCRHVLLYLFTLPAQIATARAAAGATPANPGATTP